MKLTRLCDAAALEDSEHGRVAERQVSIRRCPMEELIDSELARETEEQLVYSWRVEQLAKLGLSSIVANAVAGIVDWHEVARLVKKGCSPELALEIVL
jgi:hypothetical protein